MNRRGTRFVVALVVGVVAAAVACAPAAGRVWTATPTPNPPGEGSCLAGVSGDGGQGVWAVGYQGGDCGQGGTRVLIEHRANGRWSIIPGARLGPSDEGTLYDVAALSPDDAWAVGTLWRGDTRQNLILIERWNGTRWTRHPTTGGFRLNAVTRVPGSDHLWTVGMKNETQILAGYWDGSRWRFTAMPAPKDGLAVAGPVSVAAVSEKDVWMVGYAAYSSPGVGFAEHWNGQTWSRVPLPHETTPGDTQLNDVTVVPGTSQVWAVGWKSRFYVAGNTTRVERYSRGRWQVVPSPMRGQSSMLESVVALSPDNIWAVGYWQGHKGHSATLIEHYTNGRWTIVRSPRTRARNPVLFGLAAVPRGDRQVLWAVGARDGATWRTLALRGR